MEIPKLPFVIFVVDFEADEFLLVDFGIVAAVVQSAFEQVVLLLNSLHFTFVLLCQLLVLALQPLTQILRLLRSSRILLILILQLQLVFLACNYTRIC